MAEIVLAFDDNTALALDDETMLAFEVDFLLIPTIAGMVVVVRERVVDVSVRERSVRFRITEGINIREEVGP